MNYFCNRQKQKGHKNKFKNETINNKTNCNHFSSVPWPLTTQVKINLQKTNYINAIDPPGNRN